MIETAQDNKDVKAVVSLDPYFLTRSEKLEKGFDIKVEQPIAIINAEKFHFTKTEYMKFDSFKCL